MNIRKTLYLTAVVFLFVCCGRNIEQSPIRRIIDSLNREAFDLRYKDIVLSKDKSFQAIKLIRENQPYYHDGHAQAMNHLAYSYFLTSYFDSTRYYIDQIRNIGPDYPNREIEEAITYITEARLFLRECKYAEAFTIYDSMLTIFNSRFNTLKYNDRYSPKKFDKERYYWAKSDYLIGNAVLGYYYRDTELPLILRSLDKIENNRKLHIDTTQLSILYYTYAGSYERAIRSDSTNVIHAIENVKKGLDLLENKNSRNDYNLANLYQITGSILLNRYTRSLMAGESPLHMREYIDEFKEEYLVGKYGWSHEKVRSELFPMFLLMKADSIFQQYDDPYQNLASSLHIGNYNSRRGDTVKAWDYYYRAIECDSALAARKGSARIWKKNLYYTLLTRLSDSNTIEQAKQWSEAYSTESDIITENTRRDYNAQKGKAEAEALAKRSLIFIIILLFVFTFVVGLSFILKRQNGKLKKARTVLGRRNEELEENRADLERLVKIGKHAVSTLEIGNDSKKVEFIEGIYGQIRNLNILSSLPDLSFILYVTAEDNKLQRFCKEGINSPVDISYHSIADIERPAVGCFVEYGREVLRFGDWNREYGSYAGKVGIDPDLIDPDRTISGNSTRSLAFVNLYGMQGDKIGVLSLQTTELYAFDKPLLLASFEIIAEYVGAALDNAMQYEKLHVMQKKLIEQKRMELLTYVVRGISHELSQPLGSITQTLYDTMKDIDTLAARPDDLSQEEYTGIVNNIHSDLITISRSKDSIVELVNSFRNTVRENIIDPEAQFNLKDKLRDIVKVLKPNIKSNIHLEVYCEENLVIRSFPLLISQVITNLVSNSNQHAFPDSESAEDRIDIICETSKNNLILKCVDNGIGIPESELDKLCQPFVSKKQNNLGLGLSLVKNIVEQYMGGEIIFSSDKGLTVTVIIPDCVIGE